MLSTEALWRADRVVRRVETLARSAATERSRGVRPSALSVESPIKNGVAGRQNLLCSCQCLNSARSPVISTPSQAGSRRRYNTSSQLACWRMDRRVGRCSPVPPPDPGRHPFHDPLAGGAQTRIRRPQPQGRPLPWREAFADVVRGLPGHRIANEGADVMPHDALPKPRARRCTTCSRWTGRRSPGPGRRGRRSLVRVRPPSKAVGDGERLQSYPANRERPLTGGRPSTLPRDEKR